MYHGKLSSGFMSDKVDFMRRFKFDLSLHQWFLFSKKYKRVTKSYCSISKDIVGYIIWKNRNKSLTFF